MAEWVITCNTSYYNVVGAFKKLTAINWKQSVNIEPNDIVYIYANKPIGEIKFKCIAVKVDLSEATIDDSEFILDGSGYKSYGRCMELYLLETYNNKLLGYNYLKENGLESVQWPNKITTQLIEYITRVITNNVFETKNKNLDKEYVLSLTSDSLKSVEREVDKESHLKLIEFNKLLYGKEEDVEKLRLQFISDYSIKNILELEKEDYVFGLGKKDTFCYRVAIELRGLGSINHGTSTKFGFYYGSFGKDKEFRYRTVNSFGTDENLDKAFYNIKSEIVLLLAAGSSENYEAIELNKLSSLFKGKLLCIYYPEKYLNVYSIDHVKFFMNKLEINYDSKEKLMDLLRKLIQWKNNHTISKEWTNHEFSKFLYKVIGHPADAEKISNQIKKYEKKMDQELLDDIDESDTDSIKGYKEYIPVPIERSEPITLEGSISYPRDKQIALNALARANHLCEIDIQHPSFLRKKSGKKYTEPHHLVPMAFQEQFENSLDVEANIVSLCSNCHNHIHYGKGADVLLKKLYDERKEQLEKAGIVLSLQNLLSIY